jgi:hypothetical protein
MVGGSFCLPLIEGFQYNGHQTVKALQELSAANAKRKLLQLSSFKKGTSQKHDASLDHFF